MPTYEYRCDNRHSFDVIQRMSDDPLSSCTVCGAPARRVLSAPAVHFKGSGFYTTDYGRKNRGGDASRDNGAKDGSGAGSSDGDGGGGDAKPAPAAGESSSGSGSGSSSSSSSD